MANSCVGSALLPLPSGPCLTLELCAGAVNFRLDCGQRRVYIDAFTYAAYDSGRQAQEAFLELCGLAASLSTMEDVEDAADAWLVMQHNIGVMFGRRAQHTCCCCSLCLRLARGATSSSESS